MKFISWSKPTQGRFKLNTDGSSMGNPGISGGGGVIWDVQGSVLLAFSMNLGHGDSNRAELRALLEGVRRCKQLHMNSVDIETDSKVILSWLQKTKCRIWYLKDYWEELQELLQTMDVRFSHIFREGNAVADWLARWGAREGDAEWRNACDFPSLLWGLVRIDKWGLLAIRWRK